MKKNRSPFGYVYQILHSETNRSYIGVTIRNPHERWREHINANTDSSISRAIRKYGKSAFEFEVIDEAADVEDLVNKEKSYIEMFDSLKNGFNMSPGGDFPSAIPVTVDGIEFSSMAEASRHYGLNLNIVRNRLSRCKWTLRESLGVDPPPVLHSHSIKVNNVEYRSITQAAEAYSFDHRVIWTRLKSGWTVEQAFNLEPAPTSYEYEGVVYDSLQAAAEAYGLSNTTILNRLNLGWSIDQAFGKDLPPKAIDFQGKIYPSKTELGLAFNVSQETFLRRLRRGWNIEQSLNLKMPPGAIEYNDACYRRMSHLADLKGIKHGTFTNRIRNGWNMSQACGDHPPPPKVVYGNRIKFSFEGKKYDFPNLVSAADFFHLNYGSVKSRIKMKWSFAEVFNLKGRKRPEQTGREIELNGVTYPNIPAFAKAFGLTTSMVESRLANGASLGEAVQPNKRWVNFTFEGKDYFFESNAEAAREAGVKPLTFNARIRTGWTYPQAMGWEKRPEKLVTGTSFTVEGKTYCNIRQLAEAYGFKRKQIESRLANGWTPEEAVGITPRKTGRKPRISSPTKT